MPPDPVNWSDARDELFRPREPAMKTYQQINDRIESGKAVVLTAEEIIDYVDENGVKQIWQHGFYAVGEVDDNITPGACISCAVIQSNHERVPQGQDFFYQVDLRDELARQGALPPRLIESVSLIASGHSFGTEVIDVAFVVE